MKKIKLLIALFASTILITSCDDFGDINVDPNAPTSVAPSSLLTTAEYNLYSTLNGAVLDEWGQFMLSLIHI